MLIGLRGGGEETNVCFFVKSDTGIDLVNVQLGDHIYEGQTSMAIVSLICV